MWHPAWISAETAAAIVGLYRKLKGNEIKIGKDPQLTFEDNDPWEIRMRNKHMDLAKYQINKQFGVELNDMKINRETSVVEVKHKSVTCFKEGQTLKLEYDNSIKVIAAEVEKAMQVKILRRH